MQTVTLERQALRRGMCRLGLAPWLPKPESLREGQLRWCKGVWGPCVYEKSRFQRARGWRLSGQVG